MFIARLTSKHWHKSIISIWKEDLKYWQRQLFPICNCGFGIWLNFDAVLRYSRATMCGIAVFAPPLRPPPSNYKLAQSILKRKFPFVDKAPQI